MASRIFAGLILFAGVAILAAVGLGGSDDDNEVTSVAAAPIEAAPAAADESNSAPAETEAPETTTTTQAPALELDNYGPRKDLVNLDGWRNTANESIDDFDGKVLLVEMWTFGCHNCQARIPHTQELYAATDRADFDIIGVHAPEFDFEREIPNIEEAIERLGVTWPVALDTNKENFRSWQEGGRRFWPRTYIIDQNGDIRYDHIGEGRYDEVEQTVQFLIDNPPPVTAS